MNELKSFLNSKQTCTKCNKPLSLYLQIHYGDSFKFQSKDGDDSVTFVKMDENKNGVDSYLSIHCPDDAMNPKLMYFNSDNKSISFHCFYICNQDSLRAKTNKDNKEINWDISAAQACYIRSSINYTINIDPILQDNKTDKIIVPADKNKEYKPLSIKRECFSYNRKINNIDNVYVADFDYELNRTKIFAYKASDEDRKNKDWKPNIFEKEVSVFNKLDFSNEELMINKFDTWIVMS